MTENKQNYLEVVANAFSTARAWRMAAFTLGAVCVGLAFALINAAQNGTVILVPESVATATEKMEVPMNGNLQRVSPDYTSNVALGDLAMVLNFTPETVVTQTKRFLNRVTDSLYEAQKLTLLADAEDSKRQGISQSFYPSEVRVLPDGTQVEIRGTQIRYAAGKETLRVTVTYVISYKIYKGYMHVADLQQKK